MKNSLFGKYTYLCRRINTKLSMSLFTVLLLQYAWYFRKRPTWLSFSICATKRGNRWTSVESFSVLTCLTIDRSSTSPSYAIGKIEVSLTDVWQRADITAARSRLLDVLKFASWISFKKKNMHATKEILHQYNPSFWICKRQTTLNHTKIF